MHFVSPSSWRARCVRARVCVRASEMSRVSVLGCVPIQCPFFQPRALAFSIRRVLLSTSVFRPNIFMDNKWILCYRTLNVAFIAFLFRVPSPIISAKWPANIHGENADNNKIHKIALRAVVVGIPNFQLFIFIWKSYPVNSPRAAYSWLCVWLLIFENVSDAKLCSIHKNVMLSHIYCVGWWNTFFCGISYEMRRNYSFMAVNKVCSVPGQKESYWAKDNRQRRRRSELAKTKTKRTEIVIQSDGFGHC